MFTGLDRYLAQQHREEVAREVAEGRLGRRPRGRRWHRWWPRGARTLTARPEGGVMRAGGIQG